MENFKELKDKSSKHFAVTEEQKIISAFLVMFMI